MVPSHSQRWDLAERASQRDRDEEKPQQELRAEPF